MKKLPDDCSRARREIEAALAEGRLARELDTDRGAPGVSVLAEHVRNCAACREEVRSLADFEARVADRFRRFETIHGAPPRERCEAVLAAVAAKEVDGWLLAKTRRTLRRILTLTLFLLGLLGALGLLVAAYMRIQGG